MGVGVGISRWAWWGLPPWGVFVVVVWFGVLWVVLWWVWVFLCVVVGFCGCFLVVVGVLWWCGVWVVFGLVVGGCVCLGGCCVVGAVGA